MRKNQKGFGVVEGLLAFAIIGLVGFAGWYVWDKRADDKQTNQSDAQSQAEEANSEAYKRITTTPTDWKAYKNDKFGFSLSHPSDWSLKAVESDGTLIANFYPAGELTPQYGLYTSNQTLEQAVAERKRVANEEGVGDGLKLTGEKEYLYDGHEMVRLDLTMDQGGGIIAKSTEMYIASKGKTVVFATGFHDPDAFSNEVLTIFESLKVQ